jgi:hypothetical protein
MQNGWRKPVCLMPSNGRGRGLQPKLVNYGKAWVWKPLEIMNLYVQCCVHFFMPLLIAANKMACATHFV